MRWKWEGGKERGADASGHLRNTISPAASVCSGPHVHEALGGLCLSSQHVLKVRVFALSYP